MTPNRHDEAMDKPLTMTDAALRLQSALGRLGAELFQAMHLSELAGRADVWAMARKVDEFRVECHVLDIDPEPALARAQHRYDSSVITARLGQQAPTPFEQCIEDEWQRLIRA